MADKYKVVYRCWNEPEAEMLKGLLESYGLKPRLISHVPHSVYPFNIDGLGEIRITVPQDQKKRASEIVKAHLEKKESSEEE